MNRKYDRKPKRRKYGDNVFRSTLEARWDVFFDCLNIEYVYEANHYEVETGGGTIHYKPDFFLPMLKKYIEVKPSKPYHIENIKAAGWTKHIGDIVLLFNLNPPTEDLENGWFYRYEEGYHQPPRIEEDIFWGECPKCHHVDLNEFGWPLSCGCFSMDELNQMNEEEEETGKEVLPRFERSDCLLAAYRIAKNLKFSEGGTERVKKLPVQYNLFG